MELDAFTNRVGTGQGRLGAPSGAFEFVLGDAEAGRFAALVPGDHTGLTQDVDLAGIDLIRLQGALQVPASLPAGLAWEVSIVVAGATLAPRSFGRAKGACFFARVAWQRGDLLIIFIMQHSSRT